LLLLPHLWTDLVEILHISTCGHHQQRNRSKVSNFSFLNFSEIFHLFFLKFDLNHYSHFISLQILLKLDTMQPEALLNNKMNQQLQICNIWFFKRFFPKFWLKLLLLIQFSSDMYDILHIVTCDHCQQRNDDKILKNSIAKQIGELTTFGYFFSQIWLLHYFSVISLQIPLKLYTINEALYNNKMIH
jgi:hypothetical protein